MVKQARISQKASFHLLTPHMNSSIKTHLFAILTTRFGLSIIAGFSENSL